MRAMFPIAVHDRAYDVVAEFNADNGVVTVGLFDGEREAGRLNFPLSTASGACAPDAAIGLACRRLVNEGLAQQALNAGGRPVDASLS